MRVLVGITLLAACGGSGGASPEVVVSDASLGEGSVSVIGASASTVFWTTSSQIGGASVAELPSTGTSLAMTNDHAVAAGDRVLFVDDIGIVAVDASGEQHRLVKLVPDMVAGSASVAAWSQGATLSWGVDAAQMTVTLSKTTGCDHAWVTAHQIYVAANDANGGHLLRVDQRTGTVTPATGTKSWAPMFPGGGMAGATYRGRIVDATDDTVLWLVEEQPSGRGLLVSDGAQGEAAVVLANIQGASGFFASEASLYWQEGSEVLTAAREGGPASIVATLPGAAGALADGYLYFVHGAAIERLRVE